MNQLMKSMLLGLNDYQRLWDRIADCIPATPQVGSKGESCLAALRQEFFSLTGFEPVPIIEDGQVRWVLKSAWVLCSEKMPEDRVLVETNKGARYRSKGRWYEYMAGLGIGKFVGVEDITQWRPILDNGEEKTS